MQLVVRLKKQICKFLESQEKNKNYKKTVKNSKLNEKKA